MTIVDDIVHPLTNKKLDSMDTAKAMEVPPHESISSPYNDLAHAVCYFKNAKRDCEEIVTKRDNINIKVDQAVNKRNTARKSMEAAFEKLHR